jgi:opacity protein-like surface antigen
VIRPLVAVVLLLASLASLASLAAEAQQRQRGTSEPVGWEVAPFAGMRFGGNFDVATGAQLAADVERSVDVDDAPAYGMVVEFPSGHQTLWQVLYSHQSTEFDGVDTGGVAGSIDLDIDYLHVGGLYVLDGERVRPYVGFGLGVSQFRPDGSGFDDETQFSVGFMGGWKFRLSQRLGLRLDARALGSVVDSSSRIFCSGGCIVRWDGDMFWQIETTLGLSYYF